MVSLVLDRGGRVGGSSCLLRVVCCSAGAGAGAGSGFSLMTSKGSNGSRGGREGSALEKRDRPVLGGSREEDPSMMGKSPFGFRALIYRDWDGISVRAPPVCRSRRGPQRDVCARGCAGPGTISRTCGRGTGKEGHMIQDAGSCFVTGSVPLLGTLGQYLGFGRKGVVEGWRREVGRASC